jgi:hypothetical protein
MITILVGLSVALTQYATPREVRSYLRESAAIIREQAGVPLRYRVLRRKVRAAPAVGSVASVLSENASFYVGVRRLLLGSAGGRIINGIAPVCESRAYASLVVKSPFSRRLNVGVVTHEIGHMIGAEHSNNPNSVMFPLPQPTKPILFDSASVVSIHNCLNPQ